MTRPDIVWLLAAGFMMSNFGADESDAFKGQGCGALPFAGWEDPPLPLAALHHLHQVSHDPLGVVHHC